MTGVLSCGNTPHFKHSHEEYFYEENYKRSNDYNCLNRADRTDSIFTKKLNTGRLQARKLSILLNHTEDHFVCGNETYKWEYDTLRHLLIKVRQFHLL